ncbi:MAG: hypothetical protein HOQ04_07805 [Pseudarthrobacter sp.]|nr:hypothetical protein [Pseudarthrobacter sp.]
METLKKIVASQYFPAGAVLTAVLLFWVVGLLGGLSLLNNSQPPLTTLTWMLFVYSAAVLTPLAGLWAAVDLFRRWRRDRAGAAAPVAQAEPAAAAVVPASDAAQPAPAGPQPAQPKALVQPTNAAAPARPSGQKRPVQKKSGVQKKPGGNRAA